MDTIGGYQRNVELATDGTPVLNTSSNEQIHAIFRNVALKFNEKDHGSGTVYITTARLIWIPAQANEVSYAFPFVGMVLHAVSRDKALCETACIFIQLQGDTAEEEEGDIPIVILAPADVEEVEAVFEAISQMNSLMEPIQSNSENETDREPCLDETIVP